ncbi:Core-binding factor subunit beta [Pteropus alecto]|uniref:Core-binding factor subunit beta n=1 Tax=Pteropus alecto TaxID=9402 RepID=L5KSU7_PTEAL|nr:Core-binding factor subunit beta [Pteropus alecto]
MKLDRLRTGWSTVASGLLLLFVRDQGEAPAGMAGLFYGTIMESGIALMSGLIVSSTDVVSTIKYTGFRDRPHEERQARFQNACRDGRSEIAFVATGTNLSLQFFPASWQGEQRQTPSREYVDLEREAGKVYLKAPMILNGVCVIWKGWIDLQRLDGMGCLEFDEERAQQEDALAQQAFEEVRRRTREFEDRDRSHREEMEARRQQDPSPGSNLGGGDDLKLR